MNQSNSSDIEALRRLAEAETEASNAADLDAIMALRTDDFVSMPPNQPAVEGSQAVREFLGQMFKSFTPSDARFDCKDILASGDLGVVRGSFTWTITPAAGEPTADGGKMDHDPACRQSHFDGSFGSLARVMWNGDAASS